jgi:hypothetical protein
VFRVVGSRKGSERMMLDPCKWGRTVDFGGSYWEEWFMGGVSLLA